jgi:hypothetical protein
VRTLALKTRLYSSLPAPKTSGEVDERHPAEHQQWADHDQVTRDVGRRGEDGQPLATQGREHHRRGHQAEIRDERDDRDEA